MAVFKQDFEITKAEFTKQLAGTVYNNSLNHFCFGIQILMQLSQVWQQHMKVIVRLCAHRVKESVIVDEIAKGFRNFVGDRSKMLFTTLNPFNT